MARRGSYAKGRAKREEILNAALETIGRDGYRRTSVRELSDAVGLSQPGLLHHFGSKEELFTEVLRKRDEVDAEHYGAGTIDGPETLSGLIGVMRHNTEVPGLAKLYVQLAAEASDEAHPARPFFQERYKAFSAMVANQLRSRQAAGTLRADLDPERIARIILAIADGMQTQWLFDPDLDMVGIIEYALELLGLIDADASSGDVAEREASGSTEMGNRHRGAVAEKIAAPLETTKTADL